RFARGFERLLHGADGLAIPLHHEVLRDHTADVPALATALRLDLDRRLGPSTNVSEQTIWQSYGRLPLLRLFRPLAAPVEHSTLDVDKAASLGWGKCRPADRS